MVKTAWRDVLPAHNSVESTALIVGGGIAGLASAIALGRQGWRCTILEHDVARSRPGQGLLAPPSGRKALEQLGVGGVDSCSAPIDVFELCQRDGSTLRRFPIPGSMAVLHRDLLELLLRSLPASTQLVPSRCVGLDTSTDGFLDPIDAEGRRWRSDLVVAADGVGSLCRRLLFPQARLTPERTSEIVLVLQSPDLARSLGICCRKFHDAEAGLALGLLPCRDGKVVVFCQFATALHSPGDAADVAMLLRRSFGGWNACVDSLLSDRDIDQGRLWHTTDLDPLPQLFAGNLVLVGDSAHPLLTVTSQGASSALEDALVLADALAGVSGNEPEALTTALDRYSRARLPVVAQLLCEGRQKQQQFLDPHHGAKAASAPLVGFGLEPILAG
jgi:2-polyprenyl-6-methoxyphenol hydroxylase-like FAD-dependent oxidoreductase